NYFSQLERLYCLPAESVAAPFPGLTVGPGRKGHPGRPAVPRRPHRCGGCTPAADVLPRAGGRPLFQPNFP
ncbi:MAG: hypothetical protein OXS28_15245, partial [Gammaproteobacteria bacterium]|nr:hypothetical protein [Gammaproteobacteria bacterium]